MSTRASSKSQVMWPVEEFESKTRDAFSLPPRAVGLATYVDHIEVASLTVLR